MLYGCVRLYVCVCVWVRCLIVLVWCICDLLCAAVCFFCGGVDVSLLCVCCFVWYCIICLFDAWLWLCVIVLTCACVVYV